MATTAFMGLKRTTLLGIARLHCNISYSTDVEVNRSVNDQNALCWALLAIFECFGGALRCREGFLRIFHALWCRKATPNGEARSNVSLMNYDFKARLVGPLGVAAFAALAMATLLPTSLCCAFTEFFIRVRHAALLTTPTFRNSNVLPDSFRFERQGEQCG